MPIVVSNASPLIGLCRVDLLHVLKNLWSEIIIPDAVYNEAVVGGKGKPGAGAIEDACKDWIRVVSARNRQEIGALKTVLDEGESEVIALGQELNADLLLIDNKEPRLFARKVSLKVIGTIGILMLAWRKGFIKDPAVELNKLRQYGFWLDEGLVEQFKKQIG